MQRERKLKAVMKTGKPIMDVKSRKQAEKELITMKRYGLASKQRLNKKGMWARRVGIYSEIKRAKEYKLVGYELSRKKKLDYDKVTTREFTIRGQRMVGIWSRGRRGIAGLSRLEEKPSP